MFTITEGSRQEICVYVANYLVPRERDIIIDLDIINKDDSMGKVNVCTYRKVKEAVNDPFSYSLFHTESADIAFTPPDSSRLVISVWMTRACTFIVAYDDDIVEQNETVTVTATPMNPNDIINGTTSIMILDNDGILYIVKN